MSDMDDIRHMITRLETAGDPRAALELSRSLAEDLKEVDTPLARVKRLYCRIVHGLCLIRMTNADEDVAEKLERAAEVARAIQLPELSMLADWYGACCRLMRFVARNDSRPDRDRVLRAIAMCFRSVSQQASALGTDRLHAVALSLAVECTARLTSPPFGLQESVRGALTDLHGITHDPVGAVALRIEVMNDILSGRPLPADASHYATLLYRPGSLQASLDDRLA
jgi:hypothetical protein